MAIVAWPDDAEISTRVLCSICGESVAMDEATVGPRDAFGLQAFACNRHTTPSGCRTMLRAWVEFSVIRQAPLRCNNNKAVSLR
jgi:hypothetical protein